MSNPSAIIYSPSAHAIFDDALILSTLDFLVVCGIDRMSSFLLDPVLIFLSVTQLTPGQKQTPTSLHLEGQQDFICSAISRVPQESLLAVYVFQTLWMSKKQRQVGKNFVIDIKLMTPHRVLATTTSLYMSLWHHKGVTPSIGYPKSILDKSMFCFLLINFFLLVKGRTVEPLRERETIHL